MRLTRLVPIAVGVSCAACGDTPDLVGELGSEVAIGDPRGGLVTPEIVFRFDGTADLSLARKITISQRGASIPGQVEIDATTGEAVFFPARPLDSRYPFQWDLPGNLAGALIDTPETILAPCVMGDTDEDGIPDCKEQYGWWHAGQPLFAYGATIGVTDVFIEIDYMEDTARPWIKPRKEALRAVAAAFGNRGYAVHFDVGDLYGDDYLEGYNLGQHDPDAAAQGLLPYANQVKWIGPSDPAECPSVNMSGTDFIQEIRRANFAAGRERSFYYVAFIAGNSYGGARAVARLDGANVAISFGHGDWDAVFNAYSDEEPIVLDDDFVIEKPFTNQIINYQAGTLMHELGHNLGLREGGADQHAAKPNYFSVMSYQYQNFGLPDLATYAGDRYHFYQLTACNTPQAPQPAKHELQQGPILPPGMFRIDYSDGTLGTLVESNLDETVGIAGVGIDWNCDGDTDDVGVQRNINGYGGSSDVLRDHDDWAAITLYHRTHYLAQAQQGTPWPTDGFPWVCDLP